MAVLCVVRNVVYVQISQKTIFIRALSLSVSTGELKFQGEIRDLEGTEQELSRKSEEAL